MISFAVFALSAVLVAADVPASVNLTYSYMCNTCMDVSECVPPSFNNSNGDWACTEFNSTVFQGIRICTFVGCMDSVDCATDEMCVDQLCCDGEADADYYANSPTNSMCVATNICDTIPIDNSGDYTALCYTGTDDVEYTSEVEAYLCGGADSAGVCVDLVPTLCNESVEAALTFLKKLLTEFLIYTICVIGVIVFAFVACCVVCCIVCKKRRRQNSAQTPAYGNSDANYNVYI